MSFSSLVRGFSSSAALAIALAGCSHPPAPKPLEQIAAAPPPKDDGKAANGGIGGQEHASALEQLKVGNLVPMADKQNSVWIHLPDGGHWTRVRFWGVESLVGFRYGKDHHAIVAAFVTHVPDNKVQGACGKSFEGYAKPYVVNFDADITHEEPAAFLWQKEIVDVDRLHAKIATLMLNEEYTSAFASYPVWDNACLIIGVAIPYRGERDRAVGVRDRFVSEVLPKIEIKRNDEPKERY